HRPELGGPSLDEFALVRVRHWDFAGAIRDGELVVAAEVADDIIGVFAQLFDARFPIARMRRIDAYGGDDLASMADNNTSAYNCRRIIHSARLSSHAYGLAIDITPLQNPVIRDGMVRPPAATPYVDRSRDRPGMIHRPGPVVAAFDAIGWEWGGDWTTLKDYHHLRRARRET